MAYVQSAATSNQAALTCSPRESARKASGPAPARATSVQPSTETRRVGGRVETTEVDMRPTCGPDGRGSTRPRSHPHRGRATLRPSRARQLVFAHLHQPAVRTLPLLLWCI